MVRLQHLSSSNEQLPQRAGRCACRADLGRRKRGSKSEKGPAPVPRGSAIIVGGGAQMADPKTRSVIYIYGFMQP